MHVISFFVYQVRKIDMLDIKQEQRDLCDALENSGRAVRFQSQIATVRAFEDMFVRGCRVLHFSGHGTEQFLALEKDSLGEVAKADEKIFERLIDVHGARVRLVCLSACHSEKFGRMFAKQHVPHVICVDRRERISDSASKEMSRTLYKNLLQGQTVRQAFESAKVMVGCSSAMGGEERKYILLPEHNAAAGEPDPHAVALFKPDGACIVSQVSGRRTLSSVSDLSSHCVSPQNFPRANRCT